MSDTTSQPDDFDFLSQLPVGQLPHAAVLRALLYASQQASPALPQPPEEEKTPVTTPSHVPPVPTLTSLALQEFRYAWEHDCFPDVDDVLRTYIGKLREAGLGSAPHLIHRVAALSPTQAFLFATKLEADGPKAQPGAILTVLEQLPSPRFSGDEWAATKQLRDDVEKHGSTHVKTLLDAIRRDGRGDADALVCNELLVTPLTNGLPSHHPDEPWAMAYAGQARSTPSAVESKIRAVETSAGPIELVYTDPAGTTTQLAQGGALPAKEEPQLAHPWVSMGTGKPLRRHDVTGVSPVMGCMSAYLTHPLTFRLLQIAEATEDELYRYGCSLPIGRSQSKDYRGFTTLSMQALEIQHKSASPEERLSWDFGHGYLHESNDRVLGDARTHPPSVAPIVLQDRYEILRAALEKRMMVEPRSPGCMDACFGELSYVYSVSHSHSSNSAKILQGHAYTILYRAGLHVPCEGEAAQRFVQLLKRVTSSELADATEHSESFPTLLNDVIEFATEEAHLHVPPNVKDTLQHTIRLARQEAQTRHELTAALKAQTAVTAEINAKPVWEATTTKEQLDRLTSDVEELQAKLAVVTPPLTSHSVALQETSDSYNEARAKVAQAMGVPAEFLKPPFEQEAKPPMHPWAVLTVASPLPLHVGPGMRSELYDFRKKFQHPWTYALALSTLGDHAVSLPNVPLPVVVAQSQENRANALYWHARCPEVSSAPPEASALFASSVEAQGRLRDVAFTHGEDRTIVHAVHPRYLTLDDEQELRATAYHLAFQLAYLPDLTFGQREEVLTYRDKIMTGSPRDVMALSLIMAVRAKETYRLDVPVRFLDLLEQSATKLRLKSEEPAEVTAEHERIKDAIRPLSPKGRMEEILKENPASRLPRAAVLREEREEQRRKASAKAAEAAAQETLPLRTGMWQSMFPRKDAEGRVLLSSVPSVVTPRAMAHPWFVIAGLAHLPPEAMQVLVAHPSYVHTRTTLRFPRLLGTATLDGASVHQTGPLEAAFPKTTTEEARIAQRNRIDRFMGLCNALADGSPADHGEDESWFDRGAVGADWTYAISAYARQQQKRSQPLDLDTLLYLYTYALTFQLVHGGYAQNAGEAEEIEALRKDLTNEEPINIANTARAALRVAKARGLHVPDAMLATFQHLLTHDPTLPVPVSSLQGLSTQVVRWLVPPSPEEKDRVNATIRLESGDRISWRGAAGEEDVVCVMSPRGQLLYRGPIPSQYTGDDPMLSHSVEPPDVPTTMLSSAKAVEYLAALREEDAAAPESQRDDPALPKQPVPLKALTDDPTASDGALSPIPHPWVYMTMLYVMQKSTIPETDRESTLHEWVRKTAQCAWNTKSLRENMGAVLRAVAPSVPEDLIEKHVDTRYTFRHRNEAHAADVLGAHPIPYLQLNLEPHHWPQYVLYGYYAMAYQLVVATPPELREDGRYKSLVLWAQGLSIDTITDDEAIPMLQRDIRAYAEWIGVLIPDQFEQIAEMGDTLAEATGKTPGAPISEQQDFRAHTKDLEHLMIQGSLTSDPEAIIPWRHAAADVGPDGDVYVFTDSSLLECSFDKVRDVRMPDPITYRLLQRVAASTSVPHTLSELLDAYASWAPYGNLILSREGCDPMQNVLGATEGMEEALRVYSYKKEHLFEDLRIEKEETSDPKIVQHIRPYDDVFRAAGLPPRAHSSHSPLTEDDVRALLYAICYQTAFERAPRVGSHRSKNDTTHAGHLIGSLLHTKPLAEAVDQVVALAVRANLKVPEPLEQFLATGAWKQALSTLPQAPRKGTAGESTPESDTMKEPHYTTLGSLPADYQRTREGSLEDFLTHQRRVAADAHRYLAEPEEWDNALRSASTILPTHPYTYEVFIRSLQRMHQEHSALMLSEGPAFWTTLFHASFYFGEDSVGPNNHPWDQAFSLRSLTAKLRNNPTHDVSTKEGKHAADTRASLLNHFASVVEAEAQALARMIEECAPARELDRVSDKAWALGVGPISGYLRKPERDWGIIYHLAYRCWVEAKRQGKHDVLPRILDLLRASSTSGGADQFSVEEGIELALRIAENLKIPMSSSTLLSLITSLGLETYGLDSEDSEDSEDDMDDSRWHLARELRDYPYVTIETDTTPKKKVPTMTKQASQMTSKKAAEVEEDEDSESSSSEETPSKSEAKGPSFDYRFKALLKEGVRSGDPLAKEAVRTMERGMMKGAMEKMGEKLGQGERSMVRTADDSLIEGKGDTGDTLVKKWYSVSDETIAAGKDIVGEGILRTTREEAIDLIRKPILTFLDKEAGGGMAGKTVKAVASHFFREGGRMGEAVLSVTIGVAVPLVVDTLAPEDQKLMRQVSGQLREEFFGHASHMVFSSVFKEIKAPLTEAFMPLVAKVRETAGAVAMAGKLANRTGIRAEPLHDTRSTKTAEDHGQDRISREPRAHKAPGGR